MTEIPHPGPAPQAGGKGKAFGVYVHWPFCLSKCPYCDFNSHVRHAPVDEERFTLAFAREIVLDHGGSIEVDSGEDGTRFHLRLRRAAG